MSFLFPNTFRKAAEADIDHKLYWPNLWTFWSYTVIDFWVVVAFGAVIFGVTALIGSVPFLTGAGFLGTSAAIYLGFHIAIGTIFRRAQKAFMGKSEKEVSDIPFALGAILVLINVLHLGFLLANLLLAIIF